MNLHEGVYAALLGPSYETPAEINYLRIIGADLVGMSTAFEVIAARHLGIKVLAISCVTNMAAGILDQPLSHQEVMETGERVKIELRSAAARRVAAHRASCQRSSQPLTRCHSERRVSARGISTTAQPRRPHFARAILNSTGGFTPYTAAKLP